MEGTVKEIMVTCFHTLRPETTVGEAVQRFKQAGEDEGRRIFGMMVSDASDRLVGMVSMYDILLFIRPKHIHIWSGMEDVDLAGLMEEACQRAKNVQVGDIMSTDLISVTVDTHMLVVLDLMIKKHVRRMPVLDGEAIKGVVYISDLFYYLHQYLSG